MKKTTSNRNVSRIRIACCGFPVSKNQYYKKFDLVELQKTFYQPPGMPTVEKWREETPPNFEFTLKAWQLITHPPTSPTYRKLRTPISDDKKENYGSFKPTDEVFSAWETIDNICQILKARVIIFQCPAKFAPTSENVQNLKKFFRSIQRRDYAFAWEPRGMWDPPKIKDLCEELHLIHCVDPFKSKPLHGEFRYFRLHGKDGYRYRYTDKDLLELKEKWIQQGHIYFMFNNVFMWEDAQRFKELTKFD